MESTAFHLLDLKPVSINVGALRGAAWVCTGLPMECKARPLSVSPRATALGAGFHIGYSELTGYDGTLLLAEISAAEPAANVAKVPAWRSPD